MSKHISKESDEANFNLNDELCDINANRYFFNYDSSPNISNHDAKNKDQQSPQHRKTRIREQTSSSFKKENQQNTEGTYNKCHARIFRGRQDYQKSEQHQIIQPSFKNQINTQNLQNFTLPSLNSTISSLYNRNDRSNLNIFQRIQLSDQKIFSYKKYGSENKQDDNKENNSDKQDKDTSIFRRMEISDYKQQNSGRSSLNSKFNIQNIFNFQDIPKQVELKSNYKQDLNYFTSNQKNHYQNNFTLNSNEGIDNNYENDQDDQDSFNLLDIPIFEYEQNSILNKIQDTTQSQIQIIFDQKDINNYDIKENHIDIEEENFFKKSQSNEYSNIINQNYNQNFTKNQNINNVNENQDGENKKDRNNHKEHKKLNEQQYQNNNDNEEDDEDEEDVNIDFLKSIANNCIDYKKQNQTKNINQIKVEHIYEDVSNQDEFNSKIIQFKFDKDNSNQKDEQISLNNKTIFEDKNVQQYLEQSQNQFQNVEQNNSKIYLKSQINQEEYHLNLCNLNKKNDIHKNYFYNNSLYNKVEYNDSLQDLNNIQANNQNQNNLLSHFQSQKLNNYNSMDIEQDQSQYKYVFNPNQINNQLNKQGNENYSYFNNLEKIQKDDVKLPQILKQEFQLDIQNFHKDSLNIKQDCKINLIDEGMNNNTVKQKQSFSDKNEKPQSISSILNQVSSIFQTIMNPQYLMTPQLNKQRIKVEQTEITATENIQEQISQLQNQVKSIQNTVMQIPNLLLQVTSLLSNAVTANINQDKDTVIQNNSLQESQYKQIVNQYSVSMNQIENNLFKDQSKQNNIQVLQEDDKIENEKDCFIESNIEVENYERNQINQHESKKAQEIIKQKQQEQQGKYFKNIDEIKQKDCLKNVDTNNNKIRQNTQFRNQTPTKKLITPIKYAKSTFINSQSSEFKQNKFSLNTENSGVKKLNLFTNDYDKIQKTDEIEIEDNYLHSLYDYLNKLEYPSSFLIIKEQFPNLSDQQINSTLNRFKLQNKLGIIQLFLPKYTQPKSVRVDYFITDMIIPSHKNVSEQIDEDEKENTFENQEQIIIKNRDTKKFDQFTDEQLLNYQRELNLRKQVLLDKKQNINPSSNKIQIVQQLNEMKQVCSVVFERIAEKKEKSIEEVYCDFGITFNQ